jgi:hypothetical protein
MTPLPPGRQSSKTGQLDQRSNFTFTRDLVPVAGGMGDQGDLRANDEWNVFLATAADPSGAEFKLRASS